MKRQVVFLVPVDGLGEVREAAAEAPLSPYYDDQGFRHPLFALWIPTNGKKP